MAQKSKVSPDRQKKLAARKFQRARIRHFLFTAGPNRLSRGRIFARHTKQGVCVNEIEIVSPHWPSEFEGLRIGHVSDFHLGELLPIDRAIEIVGLLREQSPDLIACTGDVVDLHNVMARPLLDALAGANAPLGSALVLGNHDELHDAETLARMATDAGLIVLRDEAAEIRHGSDRLVVAGVDWARTNAECALRVNRAVGKDTHLLLSHNPRSFIRAAELGVPLTLAGHTHGGQIKSKRSKVNGKFNYRTGAGLVQLKESQMYVTTGVGAWFPLRVNCPAEVAMITMKRGG